MILRRAVIPTLVISASLGVFYLTTNAPDTGGINPESNTSITKELSQTAPSLGGAGARRIRNPELIGDAIFHREVGTQPSWGVGYGAEFWNVQKTPGAAPIKGAAVPGPVNVGDIIERVSHAVLPEEGSLVGRDRDYTAVFGGAGFRLAPRDSQGGEASEASFKTMSMTAGSTELFLHEQLAGAWSVLGNTVQRQLNQEQGILEHYQLTSEGVEVTWVLSKPVTSAEDLRIEAKLEGVELVGQGADGLLFGDAETSSASIRVGKVVMVDSVGQRNELALTADGNRLHIDVPSRLLTAAVYPVAIDPVVGPAFQLAYNPDDNDAQQPWVTANGTNYLVVWTDGRNVGSSNDWDIYGARVTAAGSVLDPSGIAICTGNSTQSGAQAASVDGNFLVVWHDARNQFTTDSDIYAAIVTGSGVAGTSFPVCDLHAVQEVPSVAANGTNYLVAWTDDRVRTNGSRNIFANRISSSGTPLDGDGFEVYRGGFDYEWDPAVASDGSNFMVVWTDFDPSHSGVFGRTVSATGSTGSVFTVCANAYAPSIAWSATATNYMVAFYNSSVSVNRISQNGIPLDGSSGFIIVSNAYVESSSVACNGANYLVGWTDDAAYGTFVRASDGLLGATIEIAARGQQENEICLANLGNDFLAVWSENNDFESDPEQDYRVWGALITGGATKLAFPLSTSGTIAGTQTYMSAATSGSEYLLAWTDTRNTNSDIFATRVSTSGLVLDPAGIAIATGSPNQQHPSVAFAGSHYLVAWRDGVTGVDASRIATDGSVVDTITVTSNNVTEYPGVAAAGTNFLITWSVSTNIYAARVTSDGFLLDTNGSWIASSAFTFPNPWPAGVGNDWLIAWSGTANIFATRVTAAGNVLDTPALMLNAPTNGTGGNPRVPRVSGNGTNFLVVWQQSASNQAWNVYGARISPAGSVLDSTPIGVCTTTNSQMFPSITSDGSSFFVAWADSRTSPGRLYGARVNNDGLVLDANGFLVSSDNPALNFGGYIGLASASRDSYLFAYPSTSTHASRVLIVNTQ